LPLGRHLPQRADGKSPTVEHRAKRRRLSAVVPGCESAARGEVKAMDSVPDPLRFAFAMRNKLMHFRPTTQKIPFGQSVQIGKGGIVWRLQHEADPRQFPRSVTDAIWLLPASRAKSPWTVSTSCAPRPRRSRAASKPIPEFAPVTTMDSPVSCPSLADASSRQEPVALITHRVPGFKRSG
jgi:hypothetical protein